MARLKKENKGNKEKKFEKAVLGGGLEKSLESIGEDVVSFPLGDSVVSLEKAVSGEVVDENLTEILSSSVLKIPIVYELSFKEAKKKFKEAFFRRELEENSNISMLAKFLGLDRRSIHRVMQEFSLDVKKEAELDVEYYQNLKSYSSFKQMLLDYKQSDEGSKKNKWQIPKIQESLVVSKGAEGPGFGNRAVAMTWKQAKEDFERRYLLFHFEENNLGLSQKEIAAKVGLREETVSRKLKKLKG